MLAAMYSCFGLVMPRQHGLANIIPKTDITFLIPFISSRLFATRPLLFGYSGQSFLKNNLLDKVTQLLR